LAAPEFSPRQTVYLPSDDRSSVRAVGDPEARVISSEARPEEIKLQTRADSRALLVIAQAYYHCWKATVDGNEAKLFRANYAFQAVEVPPGLHEVRLVYRDGLFRLGVAISLAALACCIIAGRGWR